MAINVVGLDENGDWPGTSGGGGGGGGGGGVGGAMGRVYQAIVDHMSTPVRPIWDESNPVGTETLQSMGMPSPSFRPGVPVGGGAWGPERMISEADRDAVREGSINLYDQATLLGGGGLLGRAASGATPIALASRRALAKPPPPSKGRGLLAIRDEAEPRLNPDAVGFGDRISTRQPSLTPDVHDNADYTVGLQSFLTAPKEYQPRAAEAIARHVGVEDTSTEGFISHLAGNVRALWDKVPEEWRPGAMGWYNGARSIAEQMAEKYGTSVRAQAGNLAAMSPQRKWEHNVESSIRIADIHANHGDVPWGPQLQAAWDHPETGFKASNPDWIPHYEAGIGKALNEIDDPAAAALRVRLHDRAFSPDTNVRVVNPDGTFGDLIRKAATDGKVGEPVNLEWGTLHNIGNALSVLRDDSLPSISRAMGDAHKVRNFYNNIVSPDAGHDVTIDTHAAAAALLRPLGASNPEVSYALGSSVKKKPWREGPDPWPTVMESAPAGLKGLYPLYAEAYRRVADELGVLPRQVQSVVWEGIRGLYNDADRKSKPLADATSKIWRSVTDGTTTAPEARAKLLARGIRPPNWQTGAVSE